VCEHQEQATARMLGIVLIVARTLVAKTGWAHAIPRPNSTGKVGVN